jgi:hypothetical protein
VPEVCGRAGLGGSEGLPLIGIALSQTTCVVGSVSSTVWKSWPRQEPRAAIHSAHSIYSDRVATLPPPFRVLNGPRIVTNKVPDPQSSQQIGVKCTVIAQRCR